MKIVCPACAAAYEVPMTLLKPGKAVRCARCAGEWVPPPPAPEKPMEATPEEIPAAAPPPEWNPRRRGRRTARPWRNP